MDFRNNFRTEKIQNTFLRCSECVAHEPTQKETNISAVSRNGFQNIVVDGFQKMDPGVESSDRYVYVYIRVCILRVCIHAHVCM